MGACIGVGTPPDKNLARVGPVPVGLLVTRYRLKRAMKKNLDYLQLVVDILD